MAKTIAERMRDAIRQSGTTDDGVAADDHSGVVRKQISVRGVDALVRVNTSDAFVVDEVIKGRAYRKLNIKPTDTVLDVGLNIGMFTVWAVQQGAAHVHGFEPEDDNFAVATHNVLLNDCDDRSTLHKVAVIGNDDSTRELSFNLRKNKGCHSLIPKRGRTSQTVACKNINRLIADIKPDLIKIDTEGAEYEILTSMTSFDGVREIILEFHHAHLNDIKTRTKYNEVCALLRAEFPYVEARDPDTLGGAWVTMIYARR